MSQPVRFIHAADLHLDAPFVGVDATDERVRRALVESTYRALDAVIDACIARDVDFLVIAGDAYNSKDKSVRAQFAFQRAMQRLAEAEIPVYLSWGNHDPADGWSAGISLPESVHVFSARETQRSVFERNGASCAIYGRSFRKAAETENLARSFVRDASDRLAVGVLHTNVGGHAGYDDYAPCSAEDLRAARMDYWALGHIHKPEQLFTGAVTVAYAGCTQGLDPTQTGARGCWEVTLDESGARSEFIATAAVIWDAITVDLVDAAGIEDVHSMLADACEAVARAADGRPAVLRVELTGRAEVHTELARPGVLRDLTDEVRAEAMDGTPWVWVDRILDRTRPAIDLDQLRASEEFAGDLVRMADGLLADPVAAAEIVAELIGPVLEKGGTDLAAPDPATVIAAARDLALDRLLAEEDR
ncbi:MAG: DNA repair exonuclease [Coriobacteriia bacterium]|nr:DNA repair exonuclease [Coriobacteriia bacterium]MBN2822492.1 DNA repair exonuclease [Coriobacteriia bacterium]